MDRRFGADLVPHEMLRILPICPGGRHCATIFRLWAGQHSTYQLRRGGVCIGSVESVYPALRPAAVRTDHIVCLNDMVTSNYSYVN